MKTSLSTVKALASAASAFILAGALVGCGAQAPAGSAAKAASAGGTLLISINPEIELSYDGAGMITEVEAKNDDGREVVADTKAYEGRPVSEVAAELVADIHAAGFFDNKVDGHDKNIVFKLEPGSDMLDASFLKGIESNVEAATTGLGLTTDTVVVTGEMTDQAGMIGLDAAKDIAMAQMGLTAATFADHDYQLEDGVYEMKFTADGVEYEYEVDGVTGKVLEADYENNDDWADKDSWNDMKDETYDPDDADTDDASDADDADENEPAAGTPDSPDTDDATDDADGAAGVDDPDNNSDDVPDVPDAPEAPDTNDTDDVDAPGDDTADTD